MRVKICGITTFNDAIDAVEAGADALGFVFYEKSPRAISIEQAAAITQKLPPFITSVALFVDASESYVEQVCQAVDIDLLQFHGQEDDKYCSHFSLPYYKAIQVHGNMDIYAASRHYLNARAILLDSYDKNLPGGTGKSFNWDIIPDVLPQPIILAGGLHSGNIAQAIDTVNPYAVDVSGGVERHKGVKDGKKIRQFMDAVLQTINA